MQTTSIQHLPSELIVQIAVHCDAISVLHLSATCRSLRNSCGNSLIFKEIILKSQKKYWSSGTLEISALQQRCGDQVALWARYAVADQHAYHLLNIPTSAITPSSTSPWSQALLIVKHPFIFNPYWTKLELVVDSTEVSHLWCVAAATLAGDRSSAHFGQDIVTLASHTWHNNNTLQNYLLGFCWTVLEIRAMLDKPQGDDSLYTNATYIDIPRFSSLDFLSGKYYDSLPLPFSRELANLACSNISDTGFLLDYLTSGVWQGYYIPLRYNVSYNDALDPAMTDIRFHHLASDETNSNSCFPVIARDCRDGVGSFQIHGNFSQSESGVFGFTGSKAYYVSGDRSGFVLTWYWSLKLTSFGLIGYWGTSSQEIFDRYGTVWLWKNK